ncbi:MAG TPA: radical SAM protein [Exilispira sp.]|nr:radical SAM protein [Exilispira sp.]
MKNFHIQWHLLNRCNLRCSHCYQYDYSKNDELSIQQLKSIADNLDRTMRRWGSKLNLLLTGGEPLLKEDLFELMNYLETRKNIIEVDIITNATLLSSKIKQLEKFKKCKNILFSLEGVSANTNDRIRGEGVFEKVIEQIKYIDSKRFKKILMFTISKKNYEDAFKLIDFGKKYGLDAVIIEKLVPIGQSEDDFSNVLTKNMLRKIWDYLLIENGYDIAKSYEFRALKIEFKQKSYFTKFFKNKFNFKNKEKIKTSIKVANCIVGKDGAAIMPDGSVYPCRRLPISIGNLLDKEFYEIFENSKILKDLKNKDLLKGKCKECDAKDCFGCKAMVYAVKKDLFSQDPHCWKS